MMAKIFFIIFLIAVLILFVIMASSVIAILFHICGEDLHIRIQSMSQEGQQHQQESQEQKSNKVIK